MSTYEFVTVVSHKLL